MLNLCVQQNSNYETLKNFFILQAAKQYGAIS